MAKYKISGKFTLELFENDDSKVNEDIKLAEQDLEEYADKMGYTLKFDDNTIEEE